MALSKTNSKPLYRQLWHSEHQVDQRTDLILGLNLFSLASISYLLRRKNQFFPTSCWYLCFYFLKNLERKLKSLLVRSSSRTWFANWTCLHCRWYFLSLIGDCSLNLYFLSPTKEDLWRIFERQSAAYFLVVWALQKDQVGFHRRTFLW